MTSFPVPQEENGGSMDSKKASIENLKSIHGFLSELDMFVMRHPDLSSDSDDLHDRIEEMQEEIEQIVRNLGDYGENLNE